MRLLAASSLSLFLVACACKGGKLNGTGCNEDKDCGSPTAAFRCEPQTGVCYCRTNDACPAKQFCNTAGFCQDRVGCQDNTDCPDPNSFCDTTTSTCLSKGRCSIDLQCPLGQVCNTTTGSCVAGCRSNGDCSGSSCRCDAGPCACTATTQADLAKCSIGVCDPNFCADNSFCKFGELCGKPDGGADQLAQCYSDFDPNRRPYCSTCTFGGGISVCGTGANYCLIDTVHPGNYFCGADCSSGQACPRGYSCQDVIVVGTGNTAQCSATNGCQPNPSLPCTVDTDCKRGGHCYKANGATSGLCQAPCLIGEGETIGFCSCQLDVDCAQENCDTAKGECTISRRQCITDQDCRTIHCVDFEGAGGCLIGQNCAPANGLTCNEVQ